MDNIFFETSPVPSPDKTRRRFSTKDCPECDICSDEVFEICHPHISSLDILSKSMTLKGNPNLIFCPMCKGNHPKHCITNPHDMDQSVRRRVVMGSSDFHNLWRSRSFKSEAHVDFDVIIGGQIHDSHASFVYQYSQAVKGPLSLILVVGINNIPTNDTSKDIVFQYKSFLKSFKQHHKSNRIFICPILFAPKFCDNRLLPTINYLQKILEVNRWIKEYNKKETGIKWDVSLTGVLELPTGIDQGVIHDYAKWREPNWRKKLHLSPEAKEDVAVKVLQTFDEMDQI